MTEIKYKNAENEWEDIDLGSNITLPLSIQDGGTGRTNGYSQGMLQNAIAPNYDPDEHNMQYFCINGTAGAVAGVNDTPTTTWWHILRSTHRNNAGYYTDLAIPFINDGIYYKKVSNGAVGNSRWVKVYDNTMTKEVGLLAYPVNSIYMSYSSTSPASLFGGTWSQITGVFLRASNDVGTGGTDNPTLTTAQMPSHSHSIVAYGGGTGTDGKLIQRGYKGSSSDYTLTGIIGNTGSGSTFSNAPKYQNLYVWRRTA